MLIPFCLVVVAIGLLTSSQSTGFKGLSFSKLWQKASYTPARSSGVTRGMHTEEISSMNTFAIRLFAQKAEKEADVLLSPVSIAAALSLAAEGVTEGSDAEREFGQVLPHKVAGVERIDAEDVSLTVATSAWLTSSVSEGFRSAAREVGAEVHDAPKSVAEVNDWVSDATQGKIPMILQQLPERLIALIINAVYFRATWTTAFERKDTKPSPFKGLSTQVDLMCLKNERVSYGVIKTDKFSARMGELPYGKNKAFSAVLLVPDGDSSLDDVVSHLRETPTAWEEWVSSLRQTKLDLLALPRFKLEYGVSSVKPTLNQLGLRSVFEANSANPPLARLTDDRDAYIDDVLHKATVECTEEGTVASAATAVVILARSLPMPGPRLVADRPFLFAIRESESGSLYFMGRIDNPKAP